MWLWIFLTLFFLISIVTSILLFYSLRRINQYENLILQFQQIITFASEKMKQVDSLGHYESDDETGFFFEQLKEIQKLLNDIFETEKIEEKTDVDKKNS
jgi:biopolymer transport protein ExbB/TolQ